MLRGDRLVMFSDGVLDAMGTGNLAARRATARRRGGGLDVTDVWTDCRPAVWRCAQPDDMTVSWCSGELKCAGASS